MIVSSAPLLQRVQKILRRMQADTNNVECLKTCCGALAILAKDEANKLLIARDGTRLILTVMEEHSTRPDLQEAVCDLLWSLAFKNGLVKEVVGRQGGIALILKGMSSHLSSPDLVKSACGALSNMCQNTYNQNIIAAHGGIRTILSALHSHRMNAPLLPFVFDALASLIVGNQRNGLLVTDGGGIRYVLAVMALHSTKRDVVKSGCHALAILSDIQGHGARIAAADGVKVLLPALRAHVRFLHLHRIAAIVLLRMLQEAAVARDIATYGGVVIMLGMLWEHAREEETVAATVHILYLITHADVMSGGVEAEVGRHLSGILPSSFVSERSGMRVVSTVPRSVRVSGVFSSGVDRGGGGGGLTGGYSCGVECSRIAADKELFNAGTVRALVLVLQVHMSRKDIARAAMRSLANLIRLCSVVRALVTEEGVLPTVLQCLAMHTTSRGITDSAVSIVGALLGAAHDGIRAFGGAPKSCKGSAYYSIKAAFTNTNHVGSGRGQFKLSVLGANGRGRQRLKSRSQQLVVSAPFTSDGGTATKNCFGLRFAYAPVNVEWSGANPETGLRGHGSGIVAAATAVERSSGFIGDGAANKRRGFGAGDEGSEMVGVTSSMMTATSATPALAPPSLAPDGASTSGATGCDVGSWSASMQALSTILRARQRDLALAGLVFLALEACIEEWVNACDTAAGTEQKQQQKQQQQEQNQNENSPSTFLAKDVAGRDPPADSAQRENQTSEDAGVAGEWMNATQQLPTRDALAISSEKGIDMTETATAVTAREKLHLEIRESLKAGLVWAEAVPLGMRRTIGGGGGGSSERRISTTGAGRHDIPAEREQAPKLADLSFSPIVAGAVERLCRLLSKGFTVMGFGRLGTAMPLEESASLQTFDVSVSGVLESLKSARQPARSLQIIKNLIHTFLPDETTECPTIEDKDSDATIAGAKLTLQSIAEAPAFTESNGSSAGGSTNDAGDTKTPGTASLSARELLHSAQPRRSNPGKTVIVGGTGSTIDSASGNGARETSPGVNESNAFWDKVGAGGEGLVVSSPPNLEPILPPLMNAAGVSIAEESTTTMSPEISEAAAAAKTNGSCIASAGAPNVLVGDTMPLRYPASVGGGVTEAEDRLWLIYEGVWAAGKGVISRVHAPEPYWIGHASPGAVCPHPHSMEFCSSFESANLLRAVQRGPAEYDLFLRPDLHTHGHTQWFYFAVRGTHPPGVVGESVVRFNVVNLTKPDSLFATGMRPVLYSHKDAETRGLGWRRCGHEIDYRSNGYSWHKPDGSQGDFYTLSLSVTFPYPGDMYRLAHAHPYSYTDHKRHLAQLLANERTARYLSHAVSCITLGGNECDLLTITDSEEAPIIYTGDGGGVSEARAASFPGHGANPPQEANGVSNNLEELATRQNFFCPITRGLGMARAEGAPGVASAGKLGSMVVGGRGGYGGGARRASKRCVFISARVHPGETPASWMMRGILDFITGESMEARLLRSLLVFKIVPMLNPDGVAFGNNRCSLAGVDLNRQWKRPSRTLHPTVFSLKQLIRTEQNIKGVAMFIDLHGHSRKMNIFMYGADEKRKGVSCPSARVFPKLLSWNRLGRKYVSFKECSFAVKKGRESTARVVVARDLGIGNSYTVESTFCGVDFGPLMNHHLNTDHLQEAGVAICDALLDYYLPNQAQREQAYRDLLTRDGVEADAETESMGLPPRVVARIDAVGVKSSGFGTDGSEDGAEGGGGGSDVDIAVHGNEARDDDDEVVDNNDDIESEDDNDSEPPEPLQEDVDGVPDSDMIIPLADGAASPEAEEQAIANPPSPADAERGKSIVGVESAAAAAAAHRGVGALKSKRDGNHDAIDDNAWLGIELGKGETGSSSALRRWGKVVEEDVEYDRDGADYGENFDAEPISKEHSPPHHERGMLIAEGGGERGAEIRPKGGDGRRLSGMVKRQRGMVSRERRGRGLAASRAMVGEGEPPASSEGRRGKRRSFGSRGSKGLTFSKGLRGKGGDRGVTIRKHQPCTSGIVGESAARRTSSNAALQAASSALAAYKGSVPTAGKSRHRVRSLNDGGVSNSDPFAPENGSVAGSQSNGAVGERGRLRGGGGGGISPRARVLAFSSVAGNPESAPPSGSGSDARDVEEVDGETATVVKRGGNLRWLSSTDSAVASPPEGNWNGIGTTLPLNLARRLNPTCSARSSFAERNTTDARCAPEIRNEFFRNSASGSISSNEDRFGGGSAMHGRVVDKDRGTPESSTKMLPFLEDDGDGNGVARLGTGVRDWR